MVEKDELCETCHATYSQRFAKNVHHEISCEQCHGGATVHLETRGTEAGTILSFRKPEKGTKAGKLLTAAERSEICLRCHEGGQNGQQGPLWMRIGAAQPMRTATWPVRTATAPITWSPLAHRRWKKRPGHRQWATRPYGSRVVHSRVRLAPPVCGAFLQRDRSCAPPSGLFCSQTRSRRLHLPPGCGRRPRRVPLWRNRPPHRPAPWAPWHRTSVTAAMTRCATWNGSSIRTRSACPSISIARPATTRRRAAGLGT